MTTERRQDLATWLTAVWDEEERRLTRTTNRGTWVADGLSVLHQPTGDRLARFVYPGDADHAEHWQPSAVLARIAADRAILELHGVAWNAEVCTVCHHPHEDGETLDNDAWPCLTVRLLASPYADREGFRSEWLVERQGVEQ